MSQAMTDCDHTAAQIVASEGGTDGEFVERYECPCGATGRVFGDASQPPQNWRRTGRVFDA